MTVFLAGLFLMTTSAASFVYFRDTGVPSSTPILITGASGLVLAFFALLLVGTSGRLLSAGVTASQDNDEALKSSLVALGNLPLGSLARFLLLAMVYLVAIFFAGDALGLREGIRGKLFVYLMSLAMVASAAIFVFADKLVSQTLLSQSLSRYPSILRVSRQ